MFRWDIRSANIDNFQSLVEAFPEHTLTAAKLSINDAARKARSLAKDEILRQVAFGADYLGNEREGRLRIKQFARPDNLLAIISGRQRDTSLARFVTNMAELTAKGAPDTIVAGRGKAVLRIKPGTTSTIDKAYILRLRNGNLGLAIRPGKGGVRNSMGAVPLFSNRGSPWYLLYGPSVQQVFNTVSKDIGPDVNNFLMSEFDRQFQRLMNKNG